MVSELREDNEVNELAEQIALLEAHCVRTKPVKGSTTSLSAKPGKRSHEAAPDSVKVEPPKSNVVWR